MTEVGIYTKNAIRELRNFSEWRSARFVIGPVPETLDQFKSETVAFLHLDMNCSPLEVAAIDHPWERLSRGAVI